MIAVGRRFSDYSRGQILGGGDLTSRRIHCAHASLHQSSY